MKGEDAREDSWLVGRGHIPSWASPTERETRHLDDAAIDRFAEAMKEKMRWEREEWGRAGWEDLNLVDAQYLANELVDHMYKANNSTFVDIANFCMMLHQRGDNPEVLLLVQGPQPQPEDDR